MKFKCNICGTIEEAKDIEDILLKHKKCKKCRAEYVNKDNNPVYRNRRFSKEKYVN